MKYIRRSVSCLMGALVMGTFFYSRVYAIVEGPTNFIRNSTYTQIGAYNVSSGTMRGTLTVDTVKFSRDNTTMTTASSGGGGSSALAVSSNGVIISSPTSMLYLVSPPLTVTLGGSTTAQISLSASSVTLQGNNFNAANKLLQLNSSGLIPNSTHDASSVTLQGQSVLTNSSATATYFQIVSSNTLLNNSSATATYLQLSSASATYLQNSSATITYLQQSSATATYFPIVSSTTLLTNSSATATYLQLSSATSTYFPIVSSTTLLTTSSASATYLTQSSAAATYLNNNNLISNSLIDGSSITKQGLLKAGSNVTLTPGVGTLTIAATASGGSSSLATSQNGVVISSPTAIINFLGPPFVVTNPVSSTATITLDASSVTLQGQSVLTNSSATATYLQLTSATATYFPIVSSTTLLTTSSATATYLQISSASATYFQIVSSNTLLNNSSATLTYLQNSSATATYFNKNSNYVASVSTNASTTGGLTAAPNVSVTIGVNPSSGTLQGNVFNGASQLLQANSSSFIPNANIDPSSVTKQGNVFNGASQLVQLSGSSLIPNANIDGSSITKGGILTAGSNITITPGSGITTIAASASSGVSVYPATSTVLLNSGYKTSTGTYTNLSAGVMHIIATSSNVTTALVSLATETTGNYVANANTNGSMTGGTAGSAGATLTLGVDPSSGTLQGNVFNGSTQLVQTNSSSFVPNANIDPSSVTKLGPIINLDSAVEVTGVLPLTNMASGATYYNQSRNSLQNNTTSYPQYLYVGSSATVPILVVGSLTGNLQAESGLLTVEKISLSTQVTGVLPAANIGVHATTHQSGGSDQISIQGLSGLVADPQTVYISTNGTRVAISTGINFIQGSNVTLTAVSQSSVTTLTIAATSSGGSGVSVYPATSTASFPFGFSASSADFTVGGLNNYVYVSSFNVGGASITYEAANTRVQVTTHVFVNGVLTSSGNTSGYSTVDRGLIVNNGSYSAAGSSGTFEVLGGNGKDIFMADPINKIVISSVPFQANGHIQVSSSPPVVSSCGSTPNGSVVGNDFTGKVTIGGGVVTSCTVTFSVVWDNPPPCVFSSNVAITAGTMSTTTSVMTLGAGATFSGDVVSYICGGYR